MTDLLFAVDKGLFHFINTTLSNRVFDGIMPALTDWNQSWVGVVVFTIGYVGFLWKGGRKARIVGVLLIAVVSLTDQLSSHVLKPLIARPRPCHHIDGATSVDHVRLLVSCGSGYSFPSSHAVNNFALSVFLLHYYPRWRWPLLLYAFLMALSRVVVGVHFPSDVAGGAFIGAGCAYLFIFIWSRVEAANPVLKIEPPSQLEAGGDR